MADVTVFDIAIRDVRGMGPGKVEVGPLVPAVRPA